MNIRRIINLFTYGLAVIKSWLLYRFRFAEFGYHSTIFSPLRIDGANRIKIGNNVSIQYKSWLASIPLTGSSKSELIIEDGCIIGNFNHIYSTQSIRIHKNVLTADKVYISDNLHAYEDITTPVMYQGIRQNGVVEIGEGTWLGENVCVLGVKIGKHCVIGANSVVTKDIPDYCVAVGSPARVIKKYDFERKIWFSVK